LQAFEREGIISRQRDGRRKIVAAA
jgi:hypothetical protein